MTQGCVANEKSSALATSRKSWLGNQLTANLLVIECMVSSFPVFSFWVSVLEVSRKTHFVHFLELRPMASRAKRQIDPRRCKRCVRFPDRRREKGLQGRRHNNLQDAENGFENNFNLLHVFSRAFQCALYSFPGSIQRKNGRIQCQTVRVQCAGCSCSGVCWNHWKQHFGFQVKSILKGWSNCLKHFARCQPRWRQNRSTDIPTRRIASAGGNRMESSLSSFHCLHDEYRNHAMLNRAMYRNLPGLGRFIIWFVQGAWRRQGGACRDEWDCCRRGATPTQCFNLLLKLFLFSRKRPMPRPKRPIRRHGLRTSMSWRHLWSWPTQKKKKRRPETVVDPSVPPLLCYPWLTTTNL